MRNACLGLTGAALQACLSAPQQVPPERSAPPPQACPAGAWETMTDTLGFRLGEIRAVVWSATWDGTSNKPVPMHEDSPWYVAGHWMAGADHMLRGGRFALPNRTQFSGRLYVKEGRVHGRFTEARTPNGVMYPVCLELLDTSENVGLELEPGSAPGKMLVFPIARVRVVDRFD